MQFIFNPQRTHPIISGRSPKQPTREDGNFDVASHYPLREAQELKTRQYLGPR